MNEQDKKVAKKLQSYLHENVPPTEIRLKQKKKKNWLPSIVAVAACMLAIGLYLLLKEEEVNTASSGKGVPQQLELPVEKKAEFDRAEKLQQAAMEEDLFIQINGEVQKAVVRKLGTGHNYEIRDEESLQGITKIITSAVRIPGIVNVTTPEFRLVITLKNEEMQVFNIWVGDTKGQQSVIMDLYETHTIYSISREMENELRSLVGKSPQ